MKKIILCGFFFALFVIAFGQTHVPNGGFEIWDTIGLYLNPDNFASSNDVLYSFAGVGNVTRSTDKFHGIYAARIETSNSYPGYIIAGKQGLNGPNNFNGGIPYTTIPDSFTGYFKYSCTNNDTGLIIVIFKLAGIPASINMYPVYGTSNTYKRFSYRISPSGLPVTPDTALIAFFSSRPGGTITHNGNWLIVDYISFQNKSSGTPAAIPNNDFENWTQVKLINPNGWNSMNNFSQSLKLPPSVTAVTPGHSGKYAAMVKTEVFDFGPGNKQTMGFLTNGELSDVGPTGGFQLTTIPDSIGFYYKYSNTQNVLDSGMFGVLFSKYNSSTHTSSIVDSYIVMLSSTSNYKHVIVPFKTISGKNPDTADIVIMSSNMNMPAHIAAGNFVTIDDISFYIGGVGIHADVFINEMKLYPNPASKQLNLRLYIPEQVNLLKIIIFSADGKQVKEEVLKGLVRGENNLFVDLNNISPGDYILSLTNDQKILFNKKFVINR